MKGENLANKAFPSGVVLRAANPNQMIAGGNHTLILKVAERKRGRMRISHFAEMLVDIEHCTALIRLAFGDPPSPKGKALALQIPI